LRESTILAKGVGGDIIAPDSLLQEVDVPSSLFDFLSLICIVKSVTYPKIFQTT
jgi:hypothetical protein